MLEQELVIRKTQKGKLVFFKAIKKVKKMGNGAHVIIPKEFIGKEVKIIWEDHTQEINIGFDHIAGLETVGDVKKLEEERKKSKEVEK